MDAAPPLAGVLETALYVDDMARARGFYETTLGLAPMFADERLTAYPVGGRSALLLSSESTRAAQPTGDNDSSRTQPRGGWSGSKTASVDPPNVARC